MIKIKRVYDQPEPDDGRRFLVDRLWPRGIKKASLTIDGWLKDLAPSDPLRRWFAHDPTKWEAFRQRYFKELQARPDAWQPLAEAANTGTITLLFSARDPVHNNAAALRDFIEEQTKQMKQIKQTKRTRTERKAEQSTSTTEKTPPNPSNAERSSATLETPPELATALANNPTARTAWNQLPPSHKREHIRFILEAKKPETRTRRAQKTIETLLADRPLSQTHHTSHPNTRRFTPSNT